jgi:hypothetical protein
VPRRKTAEQWQIIRIKREGMNMLALSHKIGRGLLILSLIGLLYNIYQMYHLDAIVPYGYQSLLFLNASIVLFALIFLEDSHIVLHSIGGLVALSSIILSSICYFDIQHLPLYWNHLVFATAIVISLTIFERLRKKRGVLAIVSMALCFITLFAFGIILLLKLQEQFILKMFWYLALLSISLSAVAIVFYAQKNQSTKEP